MDQTQNPGQDVQTPAPQQPETEPTQTPTEGQPTE
jgi:hypothetical protein